MGAAYQSQAISGYNASPPPDDGTTVAANKITWNSTIKTKLTDPLNTFAAAINSQLNTWSDFSSVTTSTNLTTTTAHHMQTIEVTSGSPTIQLGDAATMTKNYVVTVTNTGTGAPVIALATGANTLDGTAAGTFTFPTGTKTSFTFKVNNGATGYYTEKNGGKTIQAVTSVVTPLLTTSGAVNLTVGTGGASSVLIAPNGSNQWQFASGGNLIPINDNVVNLGTAANRIASVATPILDSGTTGSLSLRTNNGTIGLQIIDVSSGARNVTIASSAAGNPTISTTAGSLAVGPILDVTNTGQVKFPSSQNASANANTLDDYTENTWTPTLGGNSTYTVQNGVYTKIGRLVFVAGNFTVNAIGTGSAGTISGLPFASSGAGASFTISTLTSSAVSVVSVAGDNVAGSTTISIRGRTAASASDSGQNVFQNGTAIAFSGCYEAAT